MAGAVSRLGGRVQFMFILYLFNPMHAGDTSI
jgi:hypothetical protein